LFELYSSPFVSLLYVPNAERLTSTLMSKTIPTNGYIDPDFPTPTGPNDARIVIYGYAVVQALR